MVYLAELYRNGGQEEKAIPLYRRAMELDPTQVTAPVGLGGILMERGQYAEAIRLWQDALAKNGGLELVRINMALAQWRSGDLHAAERSLAKAVELSPGFATPVELLQKLRDQMRQSPAMTIPYRRTDTTYQVVTGFPIGISHPSAAFLAAIASPIGLPDPSSATALTDFAPSMLRSVTVPVTGSMSVGEWPCPPRPSPV